MKSNLARNNRTPGAVRRRMALALALALTVLPGQAQFSPAPGAAFNLPTLGDTERATLSPAMERKLGEEIMRDIRRNVDYLDDDPILEYLNDFGNALVEARPGARGETSFDYGFFAVRDTRLNAFALPGGFIAVHSALLLAAQSESELASVLSHEIGHVAQRHIARMLGQQRQDVIIPLASIVLAALASQVGAGGDAAIGVFAAGQGLAMQRQLNFSRDAEREADRIGFQIMDDAGFETAGMVAFFGRMQTASRSYSDLTPAYLLSHPLTTERIADIQARIREMPYRQRVDSLDFHLVRARVRVLQDESGQGLADAGAVFETQLLRTNRREIAAAQYGLAFIALKRSDPRKAQTWLAAALATLDPAQDAGVFGAARAQAPNVILAGMALDIKLAPTVGAAPGLKGVLKQAQAAHVQFPRSRAIARQYAQAMIATGQFDEAGRYLRDQILLYRQEYKLHDVLAKTYAAQGKIALQHMELAESYALRGAMPAALEQLKLARKASDASFYDLSLIDVREREWQARRLEEIEEGKK